MRTDKDGNITGETVTRKTFGEQGETLDTTENTAYTYDENGQLKTAENSSTKWEYTYDNRGNILTAKEYSVTVDENGNKVYTLVSNDEKTFAYDTTWKDKLTSYNGQSITYDESGNPTTYLGSTLTWTMGRQLASFGSNTYTYNEDGIRTSKTSNGVTTKFYLDGTNIIEQTDGTTTLHFYYDSDNEIVGFAYNGSDYFYIKNAMRDILAIADKDGNVVTEYSYNPWGKVISVTGSNVALGNLNPFRYRSYYYDSDIEMYYLQSRYYDPEICRFINCDDVNYIGLSESVVSYNPFAYCGNDSVNYVDFTGSSKTKPNVISGTAYSYNYTVNYRALSNSYRLYCNISNINVFADYKSGVLQIWNGQSDIDKIFKKEMSKTFAYALLKISKKINEDSLKGRTVNGIAYELVCHYVWYKNSMLKSHTEVTDCGAKYRNDYGYDSNAYIFEKDKTKLSDVEKYLKKGKNASAVTKISGTLAKLGWQKIRRK